MVIPQHPYTNKEVVVQTFCFRTKSFVPRTATVVMGSDAPPGRYQTPDGFSVSLTVDTPADAERIFKALSEKGTVQMPLAESFFAKRFGMVTDRFGTPWMVLGQPAG